MRVFMRALAVFVVVLCAPASLFAQEENAGFHSVGAYVGSEFDNERDWLVLGLDTRIPIGVKHIEINPRYTFHPFDGGSITQFDVNFLHNYVLADQGRFHPYVGIGAGIWHIGFDDVGGVSPDGDTKFGINLVTGTRLAMTPGARYEPFVNAQYTVMNDQINSFTLVVGVSFLID
jgi:opacity protein-like surface antigen